MYVPRSEITGDTMVPLGVGHVVVPQGPFQCARVSVLFSFSFVGIVGRMTVLAYTASEESAATKAPKSPRWIDEKREEWGERLIVSELESSSYREKGGW